MDEYDVAGVAHPDGFGSGLQIAGALDRPTFDAFVKRILVPSLVPGQTVVLDHRSLDESAIARGMFEAVGRRLAFLPTHSPDFNLIEQAFARLKHLPRRVEARRARRDCRRLTRHPVGGCSPLLSRCWVQLMRTASGNQKGLLQCTRIGIAVR